MCESIYTITVQKRNFVLEVSKGCIRGDASEYSLFLYY